MSGKLVGGDKAAVRDLTEEAIAGGLSGADLRRMRVELADSLGVSRRSLGSVSAYVEYSATEAIEESGLQGRLTNAQLIAAARLVRGSQSPDEDVAVLAEDLGLPAGELAAVVGLYETYYQGRPDGVIGGELASGNDSPAVPPALPPTGCPTFAAGAPTMHEVPAVTTTSEVAPLAPPLTVTETPGLATSDPGLSLGVSRPDDSSRSDLRGVDVEPSVGGDTANYDFPAKHEWRDFWDNYIRDRFSPSRLSEAKVICLPGRAVEPEVSRYLAMGIRPENIYCVEGSSRVRDEFLANADRLGVRAYPMTLDSALRELAAEGVRFDIVNYDFHGQHSEGHRRAIGATPMSDDCIVIYNAMGKREDRAIQQLLHEEAEDEAKRRSYIYDVPAEDAREFVPEGVWRYLPRPAQGGQTLQDLRQHQIPSAAIFNAGLNFRRYDRRLMLNVVEATLPGDFASEIAATPDAGLEVGLRQMVQLSRALMPSMLAIAVTALGESHRVRVLSGCEPVHLGLVTWHATFAVPYRVGLDARHGYLSETKPGGPRSPFYSVAARVRQHDTVMVEHRPVIEFCSVLCRELQRETARERLFPDEAGAGFGMELTDHRGNFRAHGTEVQWNDELHVLRHDVVQASVRVGHFRAAVLAATALERKHRLLL